MPGQREQHKLTLRAVGTGSDGWTQVIVDDTMERGATLRRLGTATIAPLRFVQQPNRPQQIADDNQWSRQPGNCPLNSPGTWWVYNPNSADIEAVLEPVDDGGQALAPDETPMHGVASDGTGTTSAVVNTVTQLLPANRFRRSFMVWNRGGTTIRIGRGFQPAANEGVPVFPSTAVVFGNGENCVDVIYVASSAASQAYTFEETV